MTGSWSLRTRFVVLSLVCLLPVLGVVAYIVYQSAAHNREQLITSEIFISDTVAQGIDSTLQDNTAVLQALSGNQDVQSTIGVINSNGKVTSDAASNSRLTTTHLLADVQTYRRNLNAMFLTGQTGQIDVWNGSLQQHDFLAPIANTITQTRQTAAPSVSDAIASSTEKTSFIVLTYPIFSAGQSSGQVIGVIGSVLSVDRLRQTFTPFARGSTVIMVVADGQIVATSAPADERDPLLHGFLGAQRAAGQDFTYRGANDERRLAALSSIDVGGATPWSVVVSNPANYGPTNAVLQQALIGAALAIVLALALTFVLAERTARPLERLTRQAVAMSRGDFTVRAQSDAEIDGGREVRQLGRALRDMAQRLVSQVDELAASNRLREQQAGQLRDLNRRNIRTQEEERRRIAGEIHDAVSPLITGALYQSRAMEINATRATPEEEANGLRDIGKLLTDASDELHGVIFDLRPPDLDDLGVVAAIERYIQNFSRGGMGTPNITVTGQEPPGLTPEIRVTVYRIVQEALHNIVRHSGADEAVVAMETLDNQFQVMIRDNGAGFDPEKGRRPTSLGLLSMRERAAAIGATLHIESTPGLGTAVILDRRISPQSTPARRTQRRMRLIRPDGNRRPPTESGAVSEPAPPEAAAVASTPSAAAAGRDQRAPAITFVRATREWLLRRLSALGTARQ